MLLGYDLCDEGTQMAVYNRDILEPELVGQTDGNPDAIFDTLIPMEGGKQLRDFLPRIRRKEEIDVDGRSSSPVNVLSHYFRKTLYRTRKQYPSETIKQLVVTVPDPQPDYIQLIYDALDRLGIGKDRAAVISHKQSYLYYALSQKKELWVNDVGMFDYDGTRLKFFHMQIDRRKNPIMVGVKERDFSDAMDGAESEEQKGAVFESIVHGAIHKQILSTLYMTGDGFADDWADPVFKRLCVGRRLFKGRNLYVSGACYAARELGESRRLTDFLLLDEDMISYQLSIRAYTKGGEEELILARAGTPWYQIDQSIDIIPDGEDELRFTAKNVFTKETKMFVLELEPVSGKIARQCRVGIRLRFANVHSCIVTMKDRGFGDFFPTSNRIWEKVITFDP